MPKIVHIADVHWRGLSRLDEYKRAFEKMFAELQEIKPDAIVICGDIVHSKTQGISPELIDHLTWWFKEMSKLTQVHVILGNHDGNLMNPQRQDAVSPVINAINDKNIRLYKKSGVYQLMKGYTLCVYSLFDEEGWKNVIPVDGTINIALFHGSVSGSTTDVGWELESEKDLSFFKGFDFVFLGDIHKHQYLGYRDGKPWIAYPGSTIMQDYGELPGKGYLLWDIKTRDDFNVEFKRVEHDREFRTITWSGLKETLSEAKRLPRGSRIRIRAPEMIPHVEVRQAINELTTLYGASEVVFKDEYTISQNAIVSKDEKIETHDIRNLDALLGLFKKFLGESVFTQEQWLEVKALIEKYMTRAINEDATTRNIKWQLKDLSFDNVFGYGKGNKINFKKLSGITGIFGPNRAGKSSIIGTLLYTLFNGTDRGSIKNLHVINTRKDHCKSKLTFSVDGKDYVVERQSVKHESRGIQHAVTSLNLSQVDADGRVLKDLNGEQRTDTEKVLRSLVGTLEDIMLTGVAAQGDMNKFIDAGAAYRDLVMSRFLDLLIFEKMSQYAKDDSNVLKAQVKGAPEKDWDTTIASKEEELQRNVSELLRIERVLKEKRASLDKLKFQLATEYSGDVITQADVNKVKSDVDTTRVNVEKSKIYLKASKSMLDSLNIELELIKKTMDSIPVEDLQAKLKAISTIKDALSTMRQAYEKEKQVLSNQKKSVLRLADVPCGDKFPSCKYIKDSHADKLKIDDQQTLVDDLSKKIDAADASLVDLHVVDIEKKLQEHTNLLKREADTNIKLVKIKQVISNCERDIAQLESQLVTSECKLVDYMSRVVCDDGSDAIKKSILEHEAQIDKFDEQRVKIASKKGSVTSEIARLKEEKDAYVDLKSKWYIYELFIQATSKKGIPAQIIQMQLPLINAEIERILHGVVDFTLKIEKDPESNSTDIFIDYGDSKRLIELGSGMEKMISSLAIRVALQNASSLPRPDFLVLDEGFGALDESNVEACNRLLISLKRWFKNVIVITHVDGVKDVTDNMIEITRDGKDSRAVLD